MAFISQGVAEDLRVKMEARSHSPPPSAPETPTTPLYERPLKNELSETSIGSVDVLNALNAHRESVHTADGKLIRKLLIFLPKQYAN